MDEVEELVDSKAWLRIMQAVEAERVHNMLTLLNGQSAESALREAQGRAAALGWVTTLPQRMTERCMYVTQNDIEVDMVANAAIEAAIRKQLGGD